MAPLLPEAGSAADATHPPLNRRIEKTPQRQITVEAVVAGLEQRAGAWGWLLRAPGSEAVRGVGVMACEVSKRGSHIVRLIRHGALVGASGGADSGARDAIPRGQVNNSSSRRKSSTGAFAGFQFSCCQRGWATGATSGHHEPRAR